MDEVFQYEMHLSDVSDCHLVEDVADPENRVADVKELMPSVVPKTRITVSFSAPTFAVTELLISGWL